MKGHPQVREKITYPCIVQPKLNGVRCLCSKDSGFYSGDEVSWLPKVLGKIPEQLETLQIPSHLILDGELYCHGWSLQNINSTVAVKRLDPAPDIHNISLNIFDVAAPGSFKTRFSSFLLEASSSLNKTPNIKIVPSHRCANETEADFLFNHYRSIGYEGIMYRLGDCVYQQGKRSWQLLKRKMIDDAEYEVVDYEEGKGKHVGRLGALVCKTPEGRTFNVGTGYTDKEREEFFANPPIGSFLKCAFRELSDDKIPLEPRFICIM